MTEIQFFFKNILAVQFYTLFELSKTRVTSAIDTPFLPSLPAKIISVIFSPLSDLTDCSPKTHLMASEIFDIDVKDVVFMDFDDIEDDFSSTKALEEKEDFFDKRMKILEQGFFVLNEDRKKFEYAKKQLEMEKRLREQEEQEIRKSATSWWRRACLAPGRHSPPSAGA